MGDRGYGNECDLEHQCADSQQDRQKQPTLFEAQNRRRLLEAKAEAESLLDNRASDRTAPELFKSFVDSTFGTISEGFRSFPANIAELKSRMQQEREARQEEERDIWRRWTGSDDSSDHIRMQVERASVEDREEADSAARLLLRESLARNAGVPMRKVIDLYADDDNPFGALDAFAAPMLSWGGACFYKPETDDNLPSTARWGWPAPKQRWLSVEWFKRDSYSPIRLEAQPELDQSGKNWRAAFEDLLSATLDKPLGSFEKIGMRVPYGKPQSTYRGPGLDWMLSLQCRGLLPPQLPSLYRDLGLRRQSSRDTADHSDLGHRMEHLFMFPRSTSLELREEYNTLVGDIAIQAGPSTEAQPLPIPQTAWRVPATEQELYEQMPPVEATSCSAPTDEPNCSRHPPTLTGDEHGDAKEYFSAICDSLFDDNLEQARKYIDEFKDHYGTIRFLRADITNLIAEILRLGYPTERSAYSLLVQALAETSDAPKRPQPKRIAEPAQTSQDPTQSEILSQLTTTETTRLPDGTVTTKVVLKRRFADGREETRESVQTSHESALQQQKEDVKAVEEEPKQKGWFWS